MLKKTLVLVLIAAGCAPRVSLMPENKVSREQEYHPGALNRFVDGVLYDMDENYSAALLSYQEALLYDSTAAFIYLAAAKNYLFLGKAESAFIYLQKAARLDPDLTEARLLLARFYVARKAWDEAETVYRDILSRDSNHMESHYHLAEIFMETGRLEESLDMYDRVIGLQDSPDPDVLLVVGELNLNLHRFEEAEAVYQRLVEQDPSRGFGYYGAGIAREAMGDTVQAVQHYNKALELSPKLTHARARLARIYISRTEWDKALVVYQTAVSLDSTDIASWLEIGRIHRETGDTANALGVFQAIQKRRPDDWRAYLDEGRILLDRNTFEEAYPRFLKVTELEPELFWGWLFAGICQVHMDSLEASIPFLRRGLQLNAETPLGHYYLGSVLQQLERPKEALPHLETALRLNPRWVTVIGSLAGIHEAAGRYQEADSLFQRALELEPDNPLILNNYSYSLALRKVRLNEALVMVRKALDLEPENPAYSDTRGWIHFLLGDLEKARFYIEKANALMKENPEVLDHLGDVYRAMGLDAEAANAWRKALEFDPENETIRAKLKGLEE
ncbi:MAG TPA: tetratricopeptide repeat protein [bacterium]|nr:tetratricopeptide repeat protein [bacterium]